MKTLSNQLWWVILLLASAVILPTVCLLWFMTQAVKNERLAVRQKLESIYTEQCKNAIDDEHIELNLSLPQAGGILVFGPDDSMTFPVEDTEQTADDFGFKHAYIAEFQKKNFENAISEYLKLSQLQTDEVGRIKAQIAIARCLQKSGKLNESIETLTGILSNYDDTLIEIRIQKCNAYVMLLELTADQAQFEESLDKFYDYVTRGMSNDDELQFIGEGEFLQKAIPSSLQVLALGRYVEFAKKLQQNDARKIKWAQTLVDLLTLSIETSQDYPKPSFLKSETVTSSGLFSLDAKKQLYGRYHRHRDHIRLSIFSIEYMTALMGPYIESVGRLPSLCVVYDDSNRFVAGSALQEGREPFIKVPLSAWLPGWKAHVFVEDVTFDAAAQKQSAVYLWTGGLVAALFLGCGGLTAQMITRQIKMNRLKNDFIATVTHELKTPLASMRLLVDTLLEKRYGDEKTATEYLQMVSCENKRLTHLIDSFLTFSRMERNKQVFDFVPAEPGEIARAAAESVKAKFVNGNAELKVSIDADMQTIRVDKDAMVTVIVNLLDNAFKYTNSDKKIELKVYKENGFTCFEVADNGIGISRRQQKKIFNRFYQVDSRLSRSVEGCGLGLSIVKFIVDAHKGKIEVTSTPQKGSVFTVKIASA